MYRYIPLHVAASNGHTAAMTVLLQHGANIEAVDKVTLYLYTYYYDSFYSTLYSIV